MKRRILSLLLVLLMVVQMLPMGITGANTDYSGNIGKKAKILYDTLNVSADPYAESDWSSAKSVAKSDLPGGLVLTIADYAVVGARDELWYKVKAADGGALPEGLKDHPWVFQDKVSYSLGATLSLQCGICGEYGCNGKHVTCDVCGRYDCEKSHETWCEICKTDDCGVDHTVPETGAEEEAQTLCCDGCTGEEGCLCACDGCEFAPKSEESREPESEPVTETEPEIETETGEKESETEENAVTSEETEAETEKETEAPTDLADDASGVEVCAERFPSDATVNVEQADVSAQLAEFGVPAENEVFGVDITVQTETDDDWQPDSRVLVKIPVDAPVGSKIGLLHTHNGNTTFLGLALVQSDGTVEFYTDGFSEFAGFTVDFHYSGVDYSIPGLSSILLSDLFAEMGIDEDATKATSVVFSDPSLVEVTREGSDWRLTSLQAFDTNETLIITFSDDRTIIIDVTDEAGGKEDMGDGSGKTTYRFYLLGSGPKWKYSDKGILVWYNNDNLTEWLSGYKINVTMKFPDGTSIQDTGENFYFTTPLFLKLRSDGRYWFKLDSYDKVDLSDGGSDYISYQVRAKAGTPRSINFTARDTSVSLPHAASICTVKLEPKTSTQEENRTVEVWLNGVCVDKNTVAFPVRDS
ncbi:MAG: hypothetical protein IKU11_07565, partial [Clostridia bacterium]|nr:hypothetical protein [Clostridia bacterium]